MASSNDTATAMMMPGVCILILLLLLDGWATICIRPLILILILNPHD